MTILREIENWKGKKENCKKGTGKNKLNKMDWNGNIEYWGRSQDGFNMILSDQKAANITHSC